MKNLLIFLFGAAFGVGGTLLYLRREIQKELDIIRKDNEAQKDEVPFTVGNDEKEPQTTKKCTVQNVEYHKIPLNKEEIKINTAAGDDEDTDNHISGNDETDGGIYEIDVGEFMHNNAYTKERLVYYMGDHVMATESGTVIPNAFPMVGGEWEHCVGNYAENTAFIRNPNNSTDYEIYVEEGLYLDEYGTEDG